MQISEQNVDLHGNSHILQVIRFFYFKLTHIRCQITATTFQTIFAPAFYECFISEACLFFSLILQRNNFVSASTRPVTPRLVNSHSIFVGFWFLLGIYDIIIIYLLLEIHWPQFRTAFNSPHKIALTCKKMKIWNLNFFMKIFNSFSVTCSWFFIFFLNNPFLSLI